ncbi:MAG: hypothetical protein R3D99_06720 [Altererythrobacter sp.]
MRIAFFIGTAMLLTAGAFAVFIYWKADRLTKSEMREVVVRVDFNFDQSDADAILTACDARPSSIVIPGDGTARFEPSMGISVNVTTCVADSLIASNMPPSDDLTAQEHDDPVMEAD